MSLETGRSLSHYRLLDKIGEGGMGEVWKAVDANLEREVAIKVLPDVFSDDPERLARFEREARVLASLNHANIATIHGIEHADGLRFLVMELVEGEDLSERIARGPLPVEEALAVAVQLAEALESAHEQGVIHRDLKPANVKVTEGGKVKVLDFGLAKALAPDGANPGNAATSPTLTSVRTTAGMIMGTAAYMSPEQAKGKPVDRRADVWAFGVVLHEMLSGRPLFRGDSVSETMAAVLMSEPDMAVLPPNTPRRVRRLIERCLRKDPQSRLRDVGDARVVLEEALAGREWTSETGAAVSGSERSSVRRAAALVLAGAVLGAVAMLVFSRSASAPSAPVTRVSISTPAASNPWPHISPDGRVLVYPGTKGGLYRRSLGSYQETLIRGTEGPVTTSTLSPDGTWVAYFRGGIPAKLFKVPVNGSSPPMELADLPRGGLGLTWTPAGELVTISPKPFSMFRIPADGRTPGPPLDLPDGLGQNILLVTGSMPDGRHVLAAGDSYGERDWQVNVLVLDTETGEGRVLVPNGAMAAVTPTGHLLFSRRDDLFAVAFDARRLELHGGPVAVLDGLRAPTPILSGWFEVSRGGTLVYRGGARPFNERLEILSRDGSVEPWSDDLRDFNGKISVSADGKLLAVQLVNWDEGLEEIWYSEIDRPRLRPLVDEPGLDCMQPLWGIGGELLYYACTGAGDAGGLYRRRTDGKGSPELLMARESSHRMLSPASLSPDGSMLLVSRFSPGRDSGILLLPLDAGRAAEPVTLSTSGLNERFSPDGRWIAYQSNATGRMEIHLRSIARDGSLGPETIVSREGGVFPLWGKTARNGELELDYVDPEQEAIVSVTIRTSPSLQIGEPRSIADVSDMDFEVGDILPDGRFIIARRLDTGDEVGEIQLTLNWFDELERMVPGAR